MNQNVRCFRSHKTVGVIFCVLLLFAFAVQTVLPGVTALAAVYGDLVSLSTVCKGADGKNYQVMAAFDENAGIPSDASLTACAVTKEDAAFDSYVSQAAEALDCNVDDENGIRLFDISIVDKDDASVKYQPADGALVEVKIRLAAAPENELGIVHFGEETEVLTGDLTGRTVSFETTGFSVYGIVDINDADRIVKDPAKFDEHPLYLSVTTSSNNTDKTYYFTGETDSKNTRLLKTGANSTQGAAAYYFEKVAGTDTTYRMYLPGENGEKQYLQAIKDRNVYFVSEENATLFTVVRADAEGYPNSFYLSFPNGNETLYLNMKGGDGGIGFAGAAKKERASVITAVTSLPISDGDPLDLDGKTYGIVWQSKNNTAIALTTETKSEGVLTAQTLPVRANPLNNSQDMAIKTGGDIDMFTFHSIGKGIYYITTSIGGTTRYLSLNGNAVSLVETPDQYSEFRAVSGTGAYAGRIKFFGVASNRALSLRGGNVNNGYSAIDQNNNYAFLSLAEPSFLSDDDFVPYTAIKVSVSDRQQVHNGSQVIVYTRIWNEDTKEYEYYAINHDGSLVRCFDNGDTIRWAGTQVNTLLWDFTEYYYWPYFLQIPNHYYELQNAYSGKYIAPQYHTGQILSDSTIGINLNGRRYGDYYTTILAWDDYRYDYAGLKADGQQVSAVPMAKAQDFYFAVMDDPIPDEFSTVETVDNNEHGITMRMINYQGEKYDGGGRDRTQTNVLGSGSDVFTGSSKPRLDLVTTDLKENGYPDATRTGTSLEALFGDATTPANPLFLKSTYEESGYFEYNCTQTFATLLDNGNFRVYNQLGTVNTDTNSKGHGFFMPYNDISPDKISPYVNITDVVNQPLASNDPRLEETLYGIPKNEAVYHFGMEMEASFIQSESGLDAWGHDIIFEFAGDDDMWLYVDGELVLDLGGVHSAVVGTINFRTGAVNVPDANGKMYQTDLRTIFEKNYRTRNPEKTDAEVTAYLDRIFEDGGTVFKDFSSHTMKMLYMERGAGASNLHMRFNLTTAVEGQLLLSKAVSGTDKQDYASARFPYQIHYYDRNYDEFLTATRTQIVDGGKTMYEYTGVTFVNFQGTSVPVEYADTYEVNGVTYDHVFFLKPGEVAEIQFPSDDMDYYVTECGVDPAIYDRVSANGKELSPDGTGNLRCYSTEEEVIGQRKVVKFDNHVNPAALRTLSITKNLYDETNARVKYPNDTTGFRFRVYVGVDENGEPEYYRMDKYYVKDPSGKYCFYDYKTQQFSPLDKTKFTDLTEEDLSICTFTTSPSGAIDKIPADFTVEIRNLLVDTRFLVEEQESDIPKGYDLIGYERADGSYLVEGDTVNAGIIRDRQNPHIIINNHRGWGLTVEKVWSDGAFMSSHDNIYFAVYCKGELLPGTVRRMQTEVTGNVIEAETSLYYYFKVLADGAKFADYEIKEVALTDPVTGEDGYVSSYASITPLGGDVRLQNGGIPAQTGVHGLFSYTVSYAVGEPGGPAKNIRTDIVTNTRPGIRLVKTDGSGAPLPGAVFTLKDDSGKDVTKASYTSGNDGLITYAYPENGVTYTLKETGTPDGYSSLIDAITLTLTDDELTVAGAHDGAVTVSDKDTDGTITVTIRNYRSDFTAVKKDGLTGDAVANAHFALYRQVLGTNGLRKDYYPLVGYEDLVTGADGLIPKIDSSLPTGTYYLHETRSAAGYVPLDKDVCFTVTDSGTVEMASAEDAGLLESKITENNVLIHTLSIPNYKSIKTISLSPQTLVADFGLDIVYNVKDNNYMVPAESEYAYVGICAMNSYNPYGTEEAPALLAKTEEPLQGSFGTVTLAADGAARYQIGTMSFTGEENFCLVAHVTKISGEASDVYVYEKLSYLPASTIYYEDDFTADENYHDGVESTVTGYNFGRWDKVTSGDPQMAQAADLAASDSANIFGYDPAYTKFATYSNNSAHKVSVSTVNSGNKNQNWPYMEFDFAGTGFDVVSVTGGDTGMFTVRVYQTQVSDDGSVTVGKQVKSQVVDTFYGYEYGQIYMAANGTPTLAPTDTPLYVASNELIEAGDASNLITAGGKVLTRTVTYYDAAGNVTENLFTKKGASAPDYAYAEGWLPKQDAAKTLYQIPAIRIGNLDYGTYRARIEPRFTNRYGHYKTVEGYNYYDVYMDAIRIYDPAGCGDDGTLTSTVIQEAYSHSAEAYEKFTTLKSVLVGAETLGQYSETKSDPIEGTVIVDGNIPLTTERLQEYVAYGPNNEVYLSKNMSVAFEICSSVIPSDVQIQLKKISDTFPTLQIVYYGNSGNVFQNTVEIRSSTDLSYSILDLIGRDHLKWSKVKKDYTSGMVIVTNTGEDESIISLTNLKWTFKNEGESIRIKNGNSTLAVTPKAVKNISKVMAFARQNSAASQSITAPAVYQDGKVTIAVKTDSSAETLVIRDTDGNVIDPSLLEIAFTDLDDGARQWTVTVAESEPGNYVFSVYAKSDGFTAGEPMTVTVTIADETQEDITDSETPDSKSEQSDPSGSSGSISISVLLQRIRNMILTLIQLIRQLLTGLGIPLK